VEDGHPNYPVNRYMHPVVCMIWNNMVCSSTFSPHSAPLSMVILLFL